MDHQSGGLIAGFEQRHLARLGQRLAERGIGSRKRHQQPDRGGGAGNLRRWPGPLGVIGGMAWGVAAGGEGVAACWLGAAPGTFGALTGGCRQQQGGGKRNQAAMAERCRQANHGATAPWQGRNRAQV